MGYVRCPCVSCRGKRVKSETRARHRDREQLNEDQIAEVSVMTSPVRGIHLAISFFFFSPLKKHF